MAEESKIKLFESDGETEEEDDINEEFKIRPEYQGPHGLELLEMNAELSKRFRLDERFAEDFEPDDSKKVEKETSEADEEKRKNLRILESVLGHEISTKPPETKFSKKQFIRYDPDDEDASKFIKKPEKPEIVKEKPKKSKKKKEEVEEKSEDVIPVSTERYIEVCPNLKDILSTSTPFSFSQQFNIESKEATLDSINDVSCESIEEMEIEEVEKPKEDKLLPQKQKMSFDSSLPKSKFKFFIADDDPRLKEGIEFFKRPKPLEELRVEWQKRRERVLELFRRKKRSSQRSHSTKIQTVQMKNMIRRNNFKR